MGGLMGSQFLNEIDYVASQFVVAVNGKVRGRCHTVLGITLTGFLRNVGLATNKAMTIYVRTNAIMRDSRKQALSARTLTHDQPKHHITTSQIQSHFAPLHMVRSSPE
jgi:hypothetical protein